MKVNHGSSTRCWKNRKSLKISETTSQLDLKQPTMVFHGFPPASLLDQQQLLLFHLRILHKVHLCEDGAVVWGHLLGFFGDFRMILGCFFGWFWDDFGWCFLFVPANRLWLGLSSSFINLILNESQKVFAKSIKSGDQIHLWRLPHMAHPSLHTTSLLVMNLRPPRVPDASAGLRRSTCATSHMGRVSPSTRRPKRWSILRRLSWLSWLSGWSNRIELMKNTWGCASSLSGAVLRWFSPRVETQADVLGFVRFRNLNRFGIPVRLCTANPRWSGVEPTGPCFSFCLRHLGICTICTLQILDFRCHSWWDHQPA